MKTDEGMTMMQRTIPLRPGTNIPDQVLRYARLDPDARAFVIDPAFALDPEEAWGFERQRWTARNVFPGMPTCLSTPLVSSRYRDELAEVAPDRGDPFHCLGQLRSATRALAQAGSEVRMVYVYRRAYAVALALGRCRLFGVAVPPDEDFTLSPRAFRAASAALRLELKPSIRPDAHQILQTRMDAWSVYLALDESYASHGSPGTPMSSRLRTVQKAIENFDVNLQHNIQRLTPAAATFALENWRRLLAPCYKSLLPWWLDGSIEALRQ